MKKREKEVLVKLLGGIGLIILLVGLFTPLYEFMYGLVATIAIWILTGVLKKYYGIEDEHEKRTKKPDASGLLIGGLIMLFIGIGILCGAYFVTQEEGMYIGGFITGGIGLALLISYIVLKGKK